MNHSNILFSFGFPGAGSEAKNSESLTRSDSIEPSFSEAAAMVSSAYFDTSADGSPLIWTTSHPPFSKRRILVCCANLKRTESPDAFTAANASGSAGLPNAAIPKFSRATPSKFG